MRTLDDAAKAAAKEMIGRARALPISQVLRDLFGIDHPSDVRSWKGYCPFAFEHPDGGIDKTFRTYPETNSSFCFEHNRAWDPVGLVMYQKDLRVTAAARWLLETYNLPTDKSYEDRMNELLRAREEAQKGSLGDPQYLVEALHIALRQHPAYATRSMSPGFQAELEKALSYLDRIVNSGGDESRVREWYRRVRKHLLDWLDEGE